MIYKKYFQNRQDAGRQLAEHLAPLAGRDAVVLALPRGGVPVGLEIAARLKLPLDAFVTRKIGAPGNPELGIGAVAEGSVAVADGSMLELFGLTAQDFGALAEYEAEEVKRRMARYRAGRPLTPVAGKTVILVDDGWATGITAATAARALLLHSPDRIIAAAPVSAKDSADFLKRATGTTVCLHQPEEFTSVGQWYDDFAQISDEEVVSMLEQARPPIRSEKEKTE